ncbi:hypothetical protein C9374_005649 [Naegleria lovaniensis]|uniref:HAMP domain-containing protein n=1 Tax=Naegleria lovaniensis TaxID=51637 RepID=A0AA88KI60_NAELO|nr:uncharacterized protein C9374_005649 [Naegleria lovaniensis]KAG2381857.1 hypothetical protein C9374_005649 [Naegleria lovaniensis]
MFEMNTTTSPRKPSYYNKTWTGFVNGNNNNHDSSTGSQSTAGFDSPKLGSTIMGGEVLFTQQQQQEPILNHEKGVDGLTGVWLKIQSWFGLRLKTTTALLMTSMIIVCLCALGLSLSFEFSFRNVERGFGEESVKKLSKALHDDYDVLFNKLYEYAAWDEVYNILEAQSPSQADNLLDEYFSCSYMKRVNMHYVMMYFPNQTFFRGVNCFGGVKLSAFPSELTQLDASFFIDVNIPEKRQETLITPSLTITQLMQQSGISPITSDLLPENTNHTNIIMVAAQPIQPTDNSATNGLMIFARYITANIMSDLARRNQQCNTFFDLRDSTDLEVLRKCMGFDSTRELKDYLSTQNASTISTKDAWTIEAPFAMFPGVIYDDSKKRQCYTPSESGSTRFSAFKLVNDWSGQQALVIRTDISREVYSLGWFSFLYTAVAILALVIIMAAAVLVFVEFVVLRRVLKIGRFVRSVTNENDLSRRLVNVSSDELGDLSADINGMLVALEVSQSKLANDNMMMQNILERTAIEEEKSRCILNSITDFVVTVECSSGLIININSSFENKILKKKPQSPHSMKSTPFENHVINEYITNFSTLQELLEKLDILSRGGEAFETTLYSDLGSKYPVHVSVNKTKMTVREGVIGDAFIIVMKNLSEQAELKNMLSMQQEKLMEIQKVAKFDKVMADKELRHKFKEFTIKERSSENFLFLEMVEQYKTISKSKERAVLQKEIVRRHLLPNSPQPLNVSQKILETEYKRIASGYGQLDLFDKLEVVVKGMILDDTFSRFMMERENEESTDTSDSASSITTN